MSNWRTYDGDGVATFFHYTSKNKVLCQFLEEYKFCQVFDVHKERKGKGWKKKNGNSRGCGAENIKSNK